MEKEINTDSLLLLNWVSLLQKEAVKLHCQRNLQNIPCKFVNGLQITNISNYGMDS